MIEDSKVLVTLIVGGFFGSLVRLVISPERGFHRWAARFVVGIASAVFLGGFFSSILVKWLSVETAAAGTVAAASGFILGSMAEQILARIQGTVETKKIIKDKNP